MHGRSALACILFGLTVSACSESTSSHRVAAHVRFVNGPTTSTAAALNARAFAIGTPSASGAVPQNGNWLLSPDKTTLTLLSAQTAHVNCAVTYDASKPGLAQLADCPFTMTPGTYPVLGLKFNATMQVLINDAVH